MQFQQIVFWRIAFVLIAICCSAGLSAQDRTALVISNYDYGDHQLPNVKADATAVSEALRAEGFRVTLAENVSSKELKNQIEQFARNTVTRGTAICYFAGLAGQFQTYNSKGAWWNHLQGAGKPSDVKNPEREAMPVVDVLKLLADHSTSTTNLLVVDAPSNPFLAGRSKHPLGFAAIDASDLPSDVGVLWSSAPNEELPESSRLAATFAKLLPRGRESIGKLVNSVSDEVKAQSNGKQKPQLVTSDLQSSPTNAYVANSWVMHPAGTFLKSEKLEPGHHAGQHWINSAGMVFCWCPPGRFRMGNPEPGRAEFEDAEPVEVTLTDGFWIGKYEVTQAESERVKSANFRYPFPGKHLPHHGIQQNQSSKLTTGLRDADRQQDRLPDGWEYLLPTEAQWEYACRSGTSTRYSFGNDDSQLALHANYADKSLLSDDASLQFADVKHNDGVGRSLAVVGSYRPNAWGLHDMHGNVAEWCVDRYLSPLLGGTNPVSDEKRKNASPFGIIRGGAWCSTPVYCESAFRNSEYSGGNAKNRDFIGFRLVISKK